MVKGREASAAWREAAPRGFRLAAAGRASLADVEWTVLARVGEAEALASLARIDSRLALAAGGVIAVALLLSLALGSFVAQPVGQLLEALLAAGRGDLRTRARLAAHNELGAVARGINGLIERWPTGRRRVRRTARWRAMAGPGRRDRRGPITATSRARAPDGRWRSGGRGHAMCADRRLTSAWCGCRAGDRGRHAGSRDRAALREIGRQVERRAVPGGAARLGATRRSTLGRASIARDAVRARTAARRRCGAGAHERRHRTLQKGRAPAAQISGSESGRAQAAITGS